MPKNMTEKQLEKRLINEVQNMGGLCLKWVSPGFTGVPDRKCLLPGGITWYVEVKKPGGTRTPRQISVHKILTGLGFKVTTVYSDADLKLLAYFMRNEIMKRAHELHPA